jgi:hypothetical protein
MTRERAAAIAIALALVVAGYFAWRAWAGSEADAVRARLQSLADELNTGAGEGLAAMAHAAAIGNYFTEDVLIELGPGSNPIQGRTMLTGMAARLQPRIAAFRIVLDDIGVTLAEGNSAADVSLTVSFIRRTAATGQESMDAREFALGMRRDDGTWRIARMTAVETLR